MADARAVLTVLCADRVVIVAGVSATLVRYNVNIEDIRMALMGDLFTMIALVDLSPISGSFAELKTALDAQGSELGVQILIQRKAVFKTMHRI